MENNMIGPVLPPHLMKQHSSLSDREEAVKVASDSKHLDDVLPLSESVKRSANESDVYGPILPPNLRGPSSKIHGVVGPFLPPDMVQNQQSSSSESEDDIVGPRVPSGDGVTKEISLTEQKLEMRAQYLKRKMAEEESGGKKGVAERESWMLELPPEKAVNLGLGPRSFRKRAGPDLTDRSEWTDTPADRMRKKMLGQESGSSKDNNEDMMKAAAISERDKVMEKMAESCKDEKRELSLLEMHQKKRLKKQKKEKKKRGDKPPERRPFDRNIDLQANRFDEAQKKSIFKKAQLLDTRFSSGQSKYL